VFVDLEYTRRSIEVIDQLVKEHIDTRDSVLIDQNGRYWPKHEETNIEHGLGMEVAKL